MVSFGKSSEQQRLQEASDAIASIFAPTQTASHTTRPAAAGPLQSIRGSGHDDKDDGTIRITPQATSSGSSQADKARGGWRWRPWSNSKVADSDTTPSRSPSRVTPAATAAASGSSSSITTRWQDFPPCPIQGYALSRKGLTDELAKPRPRHLTAAEVRTLIVELAGVEQSAKYVVDTQFAQSVGSRGHHGLELFVNPCLFLTGLYLTTWKTAKLYREAVPRHSVLLSQWLALVRWSMPAAEQERVAQRHRRLMQATNARVTLTFLTGLLVLGVAVVTRPTLDVMDVTPEVVQAKQSIAYQQHVERSLKWLWFVYYHHPAYAKEAKSLLTPSLPATPTG